MFVYPSPPVFSVRHWTAFDSTRTIESITEEVNKQRRVRIIFCRTEEKLRGAVYARGSKAPATYYSAIFSLICLLFFFLCPLLRPVALPAFSVGRRKNLSGGQKTIEMSRKPPFPLRT